MTGGLIKYANAEIPQTPIHAGRFKARLPEPLGGRGRWSIDGNTGDIRYGGFTVTVAATSDDSGHDLSADDEADDSGDYGSFYDWRS